MRISGVPFASSQFSATYAPSFTYDGALHNVPKTAETLRFWQGLSIDAKLTDFIGLRFNAVSNVRTIMLSMGRWGETIQIYAFTGANPTSKDQATLIRTIDTAVTPLDDYGTDIFGSVIENTPVGQMRRWAAFDINLENVQGILIATDSEIQAQPLDSWATPSTPDNWRCQMWEMAVFSEQGIVPQPPYVQDFPGWTRYEFNAPYDDTTFLGNPQQIVLFQNGTSVRRSTWNSTTNSYRTRRASIWSGRISSTVPINLRLVSIAAPQWRNSAGTAGAQAYTNAVTTSVYINGTLFLSENTRSNVSGVTLLENVVNVSPTSVNSNSSQPPFPEGSEQSASLLVYSKESDSFTTTTQVPQAILTKDLDIPNVRVATLYAQIAYSYDNIPIRTTAIPQALLLEDSTITPIRVTQSAQGLLVKQGPTDRRFTQVVSALLVKEDPTEFFLNFRPLILPDMKTLYTSSKARAFMVGDTDYIQLEGYLPEGSHLLRNGVNVGRTTPVANGDTFEVVSGVMNYFTTSILIYRYEWTGDQTIRELVGVWPVTQPELSPIWRASQERDAVQGQWLADFVNHAENEFELAEITQPKTFEIQLTPDLHQYKFVIGSLEADIHQYKFATHMMNAEVTKPKTFTHAITALSNKSNFAEGSVSYFAGFDQLDKAKVYAYKGSGEIHTTDAKSYVSNTTRSKFVDQEFEDSFGNMHSILNTGYVYAGATYAVASNEYEDSFAQIASSGMSYESRAQEILLADMNYVDNSTLVHKIVAMSYASAGDSAYTVDNKSYVSSNDSVMYVEINFVAHMQAISKVLQEYDVVTERSRFIDQYFVRYQYFPQDAEQGVIPVSYKIEVGSAVYVDKKYYVRDNQNTKVIDLVPVANSQNSQSVSFDYEKFGADSSFVQAWYAKSEYRPTLVQQVYEFYKPTLIIVESPKAMVYTYPETFYYSAGRYAGFDTIQELQDFTEYFEGTKAIPAYGGYRYTTEVDETFVCELVSNGPVKWLLQGG